MGDQFYPNYSPSQAIHRGARDLVSWLNAGPLEKASKGTCTFNRFALIEKQTLTRGLELLEIRLVCFDFSKRHCSSSAVSKASHRLIRELPKQLREISHNSLHTQ